MYTEYVPNTAFSILNDCLFRASKATNISNIAIHVAQKASHWFNQDTFSYDHAVCVLSIDQWHIQIFILREMVFRRKTRQT